MVVVGGRSQGWVGVRCVRLGWVVLWLGWVRWCGGRRYRLVVGVVWWWWWSGGEAKGGWVCVGCWEVCVSRLGPRCYQDGTFLAI